jgi:uncharacterized protein (TIGR02145 family)
MKNLFTIFLISFIAFSGFSQVPQKFSYQTVIRNSSNQLLVGQTVGIKISILQGSANGSAVYAETHAPQTNANGLATLEIGGGSLLSGNFANINWANGPFFVKTETDPNGGNNYTITNTSQLLSVPYALYAAKAPDQQQLTVSLTGDTLYLQNGGFVIMPGISEANNIGGQTGITQHTCGATNVHNPDKTYGTMTDQQGNVYKTIVIGTQEWMAENLKTTIYRNGNAIANLTDNTQWAGLTTGAWASYNNDSQYDCPYGKLYNWYAVADPRHVCPSGWHEPTDTEWSALINYIDPNADGGIYFNFAGGKLKSTGTQYWGSPNQDATNESGFSGLPGGTRYSSGVFIDVGSTGYWWSSSENNTSTAWLSGLDYYNGNSGQYGSSKQDGFSVRCLRD